MKILPLQFHPRTNKQTSTQINANENIRTNRQTIPILSYRLDRQTNNQTRPKTFIFSISSVVVMKVRLDDASTLRAQIVFCRVKFNNRILGRIAESIG